MPSPSRWWKLFIGNLNIHSICLPVIYYSVKKKVRIIRECAHNPKRDAHPFTTDHLMLGNSFVETRECDVSVRGRCFIIYDTTITLIDGATL